MKMIIKIYKINTKMYLYVKKLTLALKKKVGMIK